MKVTCDYCGYVAYGDRESLIDKGWNRAMITKPVKKTITACENCEEKIIKDISKTLKGELNERDV